MKCFNNYYFKYILNITEALELNRMYQQAAQNADMSSLMTSLLSTTPNTPKVESGDASQVLSPTDTTSTNPLMATIDTSDLLTGASTQPPMELPQAPTQSALEQVLTASATHAPMEQSLNTPTPQPPIIDQSLTAPAVPTPMEQAFPVSPSNPSVAQSSLQQSLEQALAAPSQPSLEQALVAPSQPSLEQALAIPSQPSLEEALAAPSQPSLEQVWIIHHLVNCHYFCLHNLFLS